MVFPSVPLYLDPPNWQQHPNQQLQGQNNHDPNQHHLIIPPQQQTPQPQIQPQQLGIHGGGPGPQQIRPASMAEQARQLKIPLPDAPVKCPRCESTNTKFCYFNNYSLTQPRHFCKTCRRYWTRNGALRNVPVGGGCRRNKRSSNKSTSGGSPSSSKLSLSSSIRSQSGGVNINSPINIPRGAGNSMSFMTSLQNIAQLGGMNNMGLTFSAGSMHTRPLNINNPSELGGLGGNSDHHNLEFPQQFPNFLGGFEIPGSNSFQSVHHHHHHQNNQGIGDGCDDNDLDNHQQQMNDMSKGLGTRMTSPVKMEGNGQQGLNLDNQMMIMGIASSAINNTTSNNDSNNQYWGGNMTNEGGGNTSLWTDLSGLNSSSTNHLL